MTLKERLIHARTESGFAEPADAAKRMGITPSALYQLESGKTKALSGPTAVRMARVYTDFRLEWLIDGSGPPRRDELRMVREQGLAYQDGRADEAVSSAAPQPGYVRLHLMEGAASGGDGSLNSDYPEVVRDLEIAEWQLRKQIGFLPREGRIKLATVRGDSMYPDIKNGDVVMVDSDVAHFDGDGLYLVNIHGHTFIKRLQLLPDGMHVLSTNPKYSSVVIRFDESDVVHIGGRIVGLALMRAAEEV